MIIYIFSCLKEKYVNERIMDGRISFFNGKEVFTDSVGMLITIMMNRKDLPTTGDLIGIALGNLVWQGRIKALSISETQSLPPLSTILSKGFAPVENVIEQDIKTKGVYKGVTYSLAMYAGNLLSGDVNPLSNSLITGFVGGELGGYELRQI